MASFLGNPKFQFMDQNGVPYAGGRIYTSDGGSSFDTAPRSTYPSIEDALNNTNANTNPIVLDNLGSATIVINGDTRIALYDGDKDIDGNLIWTVDHYDQNSATIYDSAGNELIQFTEEVDAVNEITIANASTTNSPSINATGDDTNVGLNIASKGSSSLKLDGGSTGTLELNSLSSGAVNARKSLKAWDTLQVVGTTGLANLSVTGTSLFSNTVAFSKAVTMSTSDPFNLLPAGMIIPYAGSSAPTGWLLCDGSAISRTTYATLFINISTTWGSGDGSTTFNVPDFRRRTLVGSGGSGSGTLGNTVGNTGGEESHTLSSSEIPAHTHSQVQGNGGSSGSGTVGVMMSSANSGTANNINNNTGGGSAHNNIQPSAVVLYIIKAF